MPKMEEENIYEDKGRIRKIKNNDNTNIVIRGGKRKLNSKWRESDIAR